MKTKDILITGLLFGFIIQSGAVMYDSHRIYKLQNEVLDTKKETIKFYNETKDYIQVLEQSREGLNNYADELEIQIKDMQSKDKLLKELRRDR